MLERFTFLLNSQEHLIKTYLLVQILKFKTQEYCSKTKHEINCLNEKLSFKLIDLFKGNQTHNNDTELLRMIFTNLTEFFHSAKLTGRLNLNRISKPINQPNEILKKIFQLSNEITDYNEPKESTSTTSSSLSKQKQFKIASNLN